MRFLTLACAALTLVGCSSHVQTTSGADYLARAAADRAAYGPQMQPSELQMQPNADGLQTAPTAFSTGPDIDAEVLRVASLEPLLRLPARIGVARMTADGLAMIPERELAAWASLAERLGPEFGDFVPVDPLIAAMVSDAASGTPLTAASQARRLASPRRLRDTIREARLGAARQHLDAVVLYQVAATSNSEATPFAMANFTLIGAMILPGRQNRSEAVAAAIMIDVRNGYPYGRASAEADKTRLSTYVRHETSERLAREQASAAAFDALVENVEDLARNLQEELRGRAGLL